MPSAPRNAGTILHVGASRGLGLAIAAEFLERGWNVVGARQDLVPPNGTIGVMSSGQGRVSNNATGGHEVYLGSKAALNMWLNMYMRSYVARHATYSRALVLMAPGRVRTELGGPDAPLGVEDSVPDVVNVLLSQQGKAGL